MIEQVSYLTTEIKKQQKLLHDDDDASTSHRGYPSAQSHIQSNPTFGPHALARQERSQQQKTLANDPGKRPRRRLRRGGLRPSSIPCARVSASVTARRAVG